MVGGVAFAVRSAVTDVGLALFLLARTADVRGSGFAGLFSGQRLVCKVLRSSHSGQRFCGQQLLCAQLQHLLGQLSHVTNVYLQIVGVVHRAAHLRTRTWAWRWNQEKHDGSEKTALRPAPGMRSSPRRPNVASYRTGSALFAFFITTAICSDDMGRFGRDAELGHLFLVSVFEQRIHRRPVPTRSLAVSK